MTIVVVLGCAAVMAAGLYCLVRPLTVARWYKKSMAGVIMWPSPSAPERDVMVYMIVCGVLATSGGALGRFALLFGRAG